MPNYACIKNEEVVNTLVFDETAVELREQFILEFDYDLMVEIGDNPVVIGDGYVNSAFVLSNPILEGNSVDIALDAEEAALFVEGIPE